MRWGGTEQVTSFGVLFGHKPGSRASRHTRGWCVIPRTSRSITGPDLHSDNETIQDAVPLFLYWPSLISQLVRNLPAVQETPV